jgi:hypothetical protein
LGVSTLVTDAWPAIPDTDTNNNANGNNFLFMNNFQNFYFTGKGNPLSEAQ